MVDRKWIDFKLRESTVNHRLATLVGVATSAACVFAASSAFARDQVKIAGSSTVFPYAKIVAENFSKVNTKFKSPVVESGGSGAGIKQFCDGVGEDKIDIANSSRRIKKSEQETCAKNGVADVVEVKFGYDGIVFASEVKGPSFAFEPKDWFLAIGAEVPVNGALAANPNKTWNEVNPAFTDWDIASYIPGEKHGTREVFETKVLVAGCKAVGADKLFEERLKASGTPSDKLADAVEKSCARVRKDDGGKHAIDIDGDYTETLARLASNKQAIGVFGLSFYENNTDKLKVGTVSGVTPSVETIASSQYPVSRPLFFYIKKAHVSIIPGLKEYSEFFVSDKMIGEDGPLAQYGLVPLPKNEAQETRDTVKNMKTMGPLS
jgi:phosphate transport system substrate-binding protein